MLKNYQEILKKAKENKPKVLSVAAAEDINVLKAVKKAYDENVIQPVLVGNRKKIIEFAKMIDFAYDNENVRIIDITNKKAACHKAVNLIAAGEADYIMKGLVGTSTLLKALLSKEYNLRTGRRLSHVAVMKLQRFDHLLIMTDGGMNMYPDLKEKTQIVQNAVDFLIRIGHKKPKVAALAAIELVNPDMQATIDAALLSKMAERNQIKNCIIDGPLAFDNAISKKAAEHKGIVSDVVGKSDILLVPNIETGNVMYKALSYFSDLESGMLIVGAKIPVVLTSRTDSYLTKFNSIILGKLMTDK